MWDGTRTNSRLNVIAPISIHPSRVGWDLAHVHDGLRGCISIHPSRVGWDRRHRRQRRKSADFNPPIPCGMGLYLAEVASGFFQFQSTHPVWDGTRALHRWIYFSSISIHPSRVGWDIVVIRRVVGVVISIHPSRVGWDYSNVSSSFQKCEFQSTHPVWDGTCAGKLWAGSEKNFNPPIPCGMGPAP